ncbi:ABC transporter permease [Pseudorhodoplanes sp.]|uniref:ABC transporter permease n=1 Tax=Pseudorhodoplanes sp. TaxID=1934341 RepID=UPI003D0B9E82
MIFRGVLIAIYSFLLAPVVIVCIVAFSSDSSFVFPPPGWSLRWFRAFFDNREFLSSLVVSLELAVVASAVSLVIGLAAAMGLKESQLRGVRAIELLFMSPLFIPRLLVGVLLFLLFLQTAIQGSFLALFLAHLLIVLPYVVRTIAASLQDLDPAFAEAARTMGASRARCFFEVTIPLIKTGLIGALLFAFSVSFTDFYLALFLTGHDTMTLPMQMFYYLEWQQDPVVAAASTIQIALILVIAVVMDRITGISRIFGRK